MSSEHSHQHDHGPAGHSHSHGEAHHHHHHTPAPVARPPAATTTSLLMHSALARLAGASALIALLWAAVAWSLSGTP